MLAIAVNNILCHKTEEPKYIFQIFVMKHNASKSFIISKRESNSNDKKLASVILNQLLATKPRANASTDRTEIIEHILKHNIRRNREDWTHEHLVPPKDMKTGDFIRKLTEDLEALGWYNLKSKSSIQHDYILK